MSENQALIALRGLVYFLKQYGVWCGVCLETGHLVTADDAIKAQEMLVELLSDECVFLFKSGTLKNFLSNPHDMELWKRWMYGSRATDPEFIIIHRGNETTVELALISEAEKGGDN